VALEHGQDEDLGALDAVDDTIRSEEHFADVLATLDGRHPVYAKNKDLPLPEFPSAITVQEHELAKKERRAKAKHLPVVFVIEGDRAPSLARAMHISGGARCSAPRRKQ
jgi:hypothetical protein